MQGIVKEIIYKDSNSEALYSILVQFNQYCKFSNPSSQTRTNSISFRHKYKRVPVVGEAVNLIKGMSSDSSPNNAKPQYYFTTPISLQKNINHNALPKGHSTTITEKPMNVIAVVLMLVVIVQAILLLQVIQTQVQQNHLVLILDLKN